MRFRYLIAALFVAALSIFIWRWTSHSYPSSILIVRHGEKSDGPHLTPIGWRRAEAFVSFFGGTPNSTVTPPAAIYAPKPSIDSSRPLETVTPLSKALNLPVQTPFELDQMKELAALILKTKANRGQEVLICYEHDRIPNLINELITQAGGKALNLAAYPDNRFDLIYVISYSGAPPKFTTPYITIPISHRTNLTVTTQELLFGDADKLPFPPFPLK
jgi:hypothetical protein